MNTDSRIIECTPDNPWNGESEEWQRVRHQRAHEVHDSQKDGWPGGDIVTMVCPDCGTRWEKELPQ